MGAVYGAQFSAKWAGDIENVVSVWADELRNFRDHPMAIRYALLNLPTDYPPNLQQFKASCRLGIDAEPKPPAIEYKMSEEDMQAGRVKVAALVQQVSAPTSHRKWIYDLRDKINKGKSVSVEVEKILSEAEDIERKEHPRTHAEFAA